MPKKIAKKKTDSLANPVQRSLTEHGPPHSLDAEKGVIGAILIDPLVCDEVTTIVRADDFFSDANKCLFRHLQEMHSSGSGIDLTLLLARLEQAGELDEIGEEAYLAEVVEQVHVAAHAPHYAAIVRDKAILRELIHTSAEILRSAYEPSLTPREIVNQSEEKIFALSDARNSNHVFQINDVIMETFALIDARAGGVSDGVFTGFTDFDAMTGGLHPGELVILAARPSMGKTALATNIADHAAASQKVPTLFVSLEMSRIELAQRMLCSRGKIDSHKLRGNFLSSAERQLLIKASNELSSAPFFVDDSPSRTVTEIGAVARRIKRQENTLGLIVIDYLGLIQPDIPTDPRQEQVAKIARRLKGLARELQVPVLCLAQLNRQTETTKDNRPRLSHLRESGAIEQDADVVMFVHREEYYHTKEEAEDKGIVGQADLMVAKQRNGPVGDIKLAWLGQYTLFANLADQHVSDYSEFSAYQGDYVGEYQGTENLEF
ncbi:MAG: replicative DNA helicase [Thermoguttaceae bacterium]